MSRWTEVEVFVQVVESGSFSSAAQRLGMSKSHASRQLSRLEGRLGVQLLKRSTRSLSLTESGRAYFQRCKNILQLLDDSDQELMAQGISPRGTLRVSVAGAFGERYVAPVAAEFLRRYPELSLDIDFSSRNVDLVEEGFDLAIRAGTLRDSSLIARRIAERRLIVCASRDYFDEFGRPDSIADLRHHTCLVGSVPTWRLREGGQHREVKIAGRWRSNNGHALLAAARRGLGLVQLPEFYVYEDIKAGRLQPVLDHCQPTDTAVWAVYPGNRHVSAKVRLFTEFLVAEFRQVDYLSQGDEAGL
ncbi:MAG: LysR substrate-binding domain-containing protein [Spongiibacter sp.]|nr:LysR substrate-binding domain-containing protein [Spongiibacter sp.]